MTDNDRQGMRGWGRPGVDGVVLRRVPPADDVVSDEHESPGGGTDEVHAPGDLTRTAAGLAYRALLDHAATCPRCTLNWRTCATRRALSRTLREVRR